MRRASSGPVPLTAPVSFPVAVVPSPRRGFRSRIYWADARGTWYATEKQARAACRWPVLRQGRRGRSAWYRFRAPKWGCLWRVPAASVVGCERCGGLACLDPVTHVSGFLCHPSFDGGLGRCTAAVSSGRQHLPLRVGGHHARFMCVCPCVCVWVLFSAKLGGPASWARFSAPHLFCGCCPCLLCFLGPFCAQVALFPFVSLFTCLMCFTFAAVVPGFALVVCLGPRVFAPPTPFLFFTFVFFVAAPWCFISGLSFAVLCFCAPASSRPLGPLFCCFFFFPPPPLFPACSLLACFVLGGGGVLPRSCFVPCLRAPRCCVPSYSFWSNKTSLPCLSWRA